MGEIIDNKDFNVNEEGIICRSDKCPKCGKEVPSGSEYCRYCGAEIKGSSKGSKRWSIGLIIWLSIITAIASAALTISIVAVC